jgi:hypothetical protein
MKSWVGIQQAGTKKQGVNPSIAFGTGMCISVVNNIKMFIMKNRMMYMGKPQIIVEQQPLFQNNKKNLTFNTLTCKF